jgi:hypothetical protein
VSGEHRFPCGDRSAAKRASISVLLDVFDWHASILQATDHCYPVEIQFGEHSVTGFVPCDKGQKALFVIKTQRVRGQV